ncbi:MAG TPA: GH116 family glycosyl-hydrolase [Roseiflexaceae bacterium]|nr:GH116 family glycosyl-hydrolase [Roseiflexaceae bacterium]
MSSKHARCWPILTRYDQDHLARIALPLGGIGTGTVSLGGRGNLHDWEIVNRPAKGFTPPNSFFALWTHPQDGATVTRALEGALHPHYEGSSGSTAANHGLPRFRSCSFAAAYPFGQVLLADPDVPLDVRIEAFNPLIPADADSSSIPVAILRFVLSNPSAQPIAAAVCGSVQNFIGMDGSSGAASRNVNRFRRAEGAVPLQGLALSSEGVDLDAEQFGTMALATTAREGVSYRTAWAQLSWGNTLLDFWDDFSDDGELEQRERGDADAPIASLAAKVIIPAYATEAITFLLSWHFPNRQSWTPGGKGVWLGMGACENGAPTIGNYYATRYSDAWDAAARTAAALPELEEQTLRFVEAFCASDLPEVVKEAALYNLSTLRTQTCFRTPDGRFWGWEGCHDQHGSCYGSCTHVWNYEQATAFLFGDLARSMREIEFAQATRDDGLMNFRVHLPLEHALGWGLAAADGQMGCIMKMYRDWQLAGDDQMLRELWPRVRAALEFCWVPGGWDADRDGVMEGCQHNTMDVEYYGPNPQMGFWYLGALRAGEEMARYLGEDDFAATCRDLFERGGRWSDQHLFNGDYYEHEIRPPGVGAAIAPGLRHHSMGASDLSDPDLQLGAGCLVDQLVGQYMAHVCGLGYLAEPGRIQRTLQSIMRYNFKPSLYGHFNHMRSFALNDESALLMATYPKGRRPTRPFPYFTEVMTGFEYSAAVHMLYEGQVDAGLRCIGAIRARYDGKRRSPFDEAECGHHYARAMASWAAVLALSGFHYSGVDRSMTFAAPEQRVQAFWSNGYAWGTCTRTPAPDGADVELTVLHGTLALRRLTITGVGVAEFETPRVIGAGERLAVRVLR